MNIPTNLLLFFVTFYLLSYVKLALFKSERDEKKKTNDKLTELRSIKTKTLDEQKKFLDTKFPKSGPFKWSWSGAGKFLLRAAAFITTILSLKWMWAKWVGVEISISTLIIFIIIFPLISNWVLKRFNLQGDDVSIYFK